MAPASAPASKSGGSLVWEVIKALLLISILAFVLATLGVATDARMTTRSIYNEARACAGAWTARARPCRPSGTPLAVRRCARAAGRRGGPVASAAGRAPVGAAS